MIHSGRFTALLDANVLYPAPIRDYLLHLASLDLYKPKWSSEIQEEWIKNLLIKRPDLTREALERTKSAMNAAFPDASVSQYEELIPSLNLPDPHDRHVLAAALRGKADIIITFNLKDFPSKILSAFEMEVQGPDMFISDLINLDKKKCRQALNNLVKSLKVVPKTQEEVLTTLSGCGLFNSVELLKEL
jgi:predicted nucleic acid-binding protein